MARKGKRLTLFVACGGLVLIFIIAGLYWDDIVVWYRFTRDFERLPQNEQGHPEYRHRQTGIVMVRVPRGTFAIGTSQEERERMPEEFEAWKEVLNHDQSQHNVTLSPFLIAKYELTQAVWQSVMGNNPSHVPGDDLPVEGVSWNDCQEFYKKSGLSLPTEAQWEYACRAGKSGHFSGTGKLDEMGWYRENSNERAHSVGQKDPNDFGLHDMHGNVYEYCEDAVFAGKTKSKPGSKGWNPWWLTGNRVVRGGTWNSSAWLCRSASRLSMQCAPAVVLASARPTIRYHEQT